MKKNYNMKFAILSTLAIIFVVLGHIGSNLLTIDNLFPFYSFHMPLFIFISGYFYKESNENHIVSYLCNKVLFLIVPFYIWSFLYLLFQTVLNHNGYAIGNSFSLYNLLIWPWTRNQPIGFNAPSWYIIAFFGVLIINVIVRKLFSYFPKNEFFITILYMILSIISTYLNQKYTLSESMINISRPYFMLIFYQAGHLYKIFFEKNMPLIKNIPYFLCILFLSGILRCQFGPLSYGIYNMSDIHTCLPAVYLNTFLGIAFWLRIADILSSLLYNSTLIQYISQHTFDIMMHHLFGIFLIQSVIAFIASYTSLCATFDFAGYRTWVYYLYVPFKGYKPLIAIAAIAISLFIAYIKDTIVKQIKHLSCNLNKK